MNGESDNGESGRERLPELLRTLSTIGEADAPDAVAILLAASVFSAMQSGPEAIAVLVGRLTGALINACTVPGRPALIPLRAILHAAAVAGACIARMEGHPEDPESGEEITPRFIASVLADELTEEDWRELADGIDTARAEMEETRSDPWEGTNGFHNGTDETADADTPALAPDMSEDDREDAAVIRDAELIAELDRAFSLPDAERED